MNEDTHDTLISKRIESNDDDHLDMEDQDYDFQESKGYFQSQSMKLKRVTFKINLIWSGDVSKRKWVIVSYHKVCKPTLKGALYLKLCWELLISKESWEDVLISRVIDNDGTINYHIFILFGEVLKKNTMCYEQTQTGFFVMEKKIKLWKVS